MQEFSSYLVFVDESGDHSLESIDYNFPVFVLCMCIIKKSVYTDELIPKIKALKIATFGHDSIVLHEKDIVQRKGDFARLNKEQREAFLSKLTTIIDATDFTVVAVVIRKVEHKLQYRRPDHPYHLAMQFGLERLRAFLRRQGESDQTVHVICEARGKKEDAELELNFRRVCDGENWDAQRYPFTIVMDDKRGNSEGLQLADLLARPVGLSVLRPEQQNRTYEIIGRKLYRNGFGVAAGYGLKVFP